MQPKINLDDLYDAVQWADAGETAGVECQAYIDRTTGAIHWIGEGIDEEAPDDIEDEDKYVPVPGRLEVDLGRPLVMRFVSEQLPDSYDLVQQFFRKKGAYASFTALLDRKDKLDAWHDYKQKAIEDALREWCEENDFQVDNDTPLSI